MSGWTLRGLRTAARAIALFALWMLLVDNLHGPEIITGIVAACLTAVFGEVVGALAGEPVSIGPRMLRRVYRPFVLLVTDTGRVTLALARALIGRPPSGCFRAVRYRATGEEREARTRRILTEWGASLSPNRYAIGIDTDSGYLMVHELLADDGPLDPLELG